MQDKHKSTQANNKEEIVVEENINKAAENDSKLVAKGSSSTNLKQSNAKSANSTQKRVTSKKVITFPEK